MANVTKREKKTCRQLWSSLDTPGPHWTRTRRRLHTWADRSLSWKDVEAHIADVEDVEYVESHIAEDLSFNFSQVEDIGFEKVCLRLSLACCIVCIVCVIKNLSSAEQKIGKHFKGGWVCLWQFVADFTPHHRDYVHQDDDHDHHHDHCDHLRSSLRRAGDKWPAIRRTRCSSHSVFSWASSSGCFIMMMMIRINVYHCEGFHYHYDDH